MASPDLKVTCGKCGADIDEPTNIPEAERKQCPNCGSKSRSCNVHIKDSETAHDGLKLKARHGPKGRPFLETKVGEEISHKKGKLVNRSVRVDRDNDKYSEVVVDKETNKVIHQCEEPLTKHTGHGTARRKKPKNV
jgi:ribosomal protein S27AE